MLGSRLGPLDGLRGVALVAVLIYHALPTSLPGGFLGVEMFFVLSGFLLVGLLLEESDRTGGIDLPAYAGRRARRIFPALLVLLATCAVVLPILAPDLIGSLVRDIGTSALGLTNWDLIAQGSSYFDQLGRPSPVRHLWSIGVELQGYIVLGLVAVVVARRTRSTAVAVLGVGIVGSWAAMFILYVSPDPSRAYFGTDGRVGAMLAGAVLAVVLRRWRPKVPFPVTMVAVMTLAVLVARTDEVARWLYPGGFAVTQLATALVITAALGTTATAVVLGWGPLRWLGRRSYGIYLWHWPIVALTRPGIDVDWSPVTSAVVGMGAAVALGAVSYAFVERPFLDRRLVVPRSSRIGAAVGTVGVLVAALSFTAADTRVDPITASIRAGQRALADTTPAPARLPSPDDAAEVPDPDVPLVAVGDSVMLGAATALQERFDADIHVDAAVSRYFDAATAIAEELREQDRLSDQLILHLGNNGPVASEQIDTFMEAVPDVDMVLLVTVRVGRRWEASVNQTLHDAASRYRKIRLVDWYAASQGHRSWLHADGTHMRPAGAAAYADLVAEAVATVPPPTPTPHGATRAFRDSLRRLDAEAAFRASPGTSSSEPVFVFGALGVLLAVSWPLARTLRRPDDDLDAPPVPVAQRKVSPTSSPNARVPTEVGSPRSVVP